MEVVLYASNTQASISILTNHVVHFLAK